MDVIKLDHCEDARNAPSPVGMFALLFKGMAIASHPVSKRRSQIIMHDLSPVDPAS